MTMTLINSNVISNVPLIYSFGSSAYGVYKHESFTDTTSVIAELEPEKEISSYDLMCGSGALAIWEDPEEDIYSFEDGEAL